MKKRTLDIVLIVLLLAICIAAIMITGRRSQKGSYVCITVNGEVQTYLPLDVDGVFPLNGGTNTLHIENGSAYMVEASCPDKICITQGKISKTGQQIVCLPNRLIVTVTSSPEEVFY